MNIDSFFSDETSNYIVKKEGAGEGIVDIYFRAFKGEKINIALYEGSDIYPMVFEYTRGSFDYYKTTVTLKGNCLSYFFEITQDTRHLYYDKLGTTDQPRDYARFRYRADFDVPEWSKGAVMYQIMVDRFYNGDPSNDVVSDEYYYIDRNSKKITDWNAYPQPFDVSNFYGGDLEGVLKKLSYLKSLGIEVIYFNPLFVSPSNHKYDTQDYDYIDPHIGRIVNDEEGLLSLGDIDNKHAYKFKKRVTDMENLEASNKFFADFVEAAHSLGIKVILDGVFNHCGSFNKWLDREGIYKGATGFSTGAYHSSDSPYRDYFDFQKDDWPENKTYSGWWQHDTLPKLNYEGSSTLEEYILSIGAKWLSPPYNADGWRLDVAADLGKSEEYNHRFWARFRKRIKEANPDALILAEHYGNASPWLSGDEWDSIMNYDAFMDPVSFFLTGMEKHSDKKKEELKGDGFAFETAMKDNMLQFMAPSLLCAMNQLSNHDHSRFLTRTNGKVGRIDTLGSLAASEDINLAVYRNATLIQMTWPGAPTLYYGDEAGQTGFTDPDSRRTYPWGKENTALIDFTRDAITLHKYNPCLKSGSLMFLDSRQGYISYARFDHLSCIIVVINALDEEYGAHIPVWRSGVPMDCNIKRIMTNRQEGYSILPVDHVIEKGYLDINLTPYCGYVFKFS